MGRRPIGRRAMTSSERQRRFLDRIRAKAAAAARAPTQAPATSPDGATILAVYRYLGAYPELTADAMPGIIGDKAARAFYTALGRRLAKRPPELDE